MENNYFISALQNFCKKENAYDKSKFYCEQLDDKLTISYRTLVDFLFPDMVYVSLHIMNDWENIDVEFGADDMFELQDETHQYYIVDVDNWRLEQYKKYMNNTDNTSDIVLYYHDKLEVYILGVTHYGTSWNYVPTNIKLNPTGGNENEKQD